MIKQQSIAVVIATFNAEKTIGKAVESVLAQDYANLQLWIIDGASTDKTIEIVTSYKDCRVKIISEADRGIYDAWNKGVLKTDAQRILFIGADDTLGSSSAISDFWKSVEKESYLKPILYGNLIALDWSGAQVGRVGGKWRNPWTFAGRHIWSSFPIPIMSSFFDRKAIISSGMFDSSLRIMADIDLVLRIAKENEPAYINCGAITQMGFGGISTKPETGVIAMREAAKIRRRHGLGVYTNLEFLLRQIQHRIKYFVTKYLGKRASKFMVDLIHYLKRRFY